MPFRSSYLALVIALFAGPVEAQVPGAPTVTVSGMVRDSIAHTPLVGATVQLVAADGSGHPAHSAISDTLGRFVLPDVPAGRYTIGFFHPMLDSLGLEPPLHPVVVEQQPVRVDLAIPSAAQLRAAFCRSAQGEDSSAVVIGVVRTAQDDAPVAGASVVVTWMEYTFSPQGVSRRMPRLTATTGDNGWFALCSVPAGGTITLQASHAGESTDLLEVEVSVDGFLRRQLYLSATKTEVVDRQGAAGTGRMVASEDGVSRGDTLRLPPRPLHVGDGRLRGTVVAAAGGAPLSGAQVGVADGPQTRTNERGEWSLSELPAGTRRLEIRAVGYYPVQRPVNVLPDAPAIQVSLSTLKAVLDTIRVTARLDVRPSTGFEQRRITGMGRFLTAKDIARRASFFTSSLFRNMPGMRLERDTSTGDTILFQRGAFGWCAPTVYLDGHYIAGAVIEDIDGWVAPSKITGIEIYDESMVPAQFQRGMTGCGAVLIWSR